jgi:hypothetical protein
MWGNVCGATIMVVSVTRGTIMIVVTMDVTWVTIMVVVTNVTESTIMIVVTMDVTMRNLVQDQPWGALIGGNNIAER